MKFLTAFLLLCTCAVFPQKPEFAFPLIPAGLTENANAVVRLNKLDIEIPSKSTVVIKTYRAVTVLNEKGLSALNANETRNVRSIGAVVYDAYGVEIKKLRRKDFKETSVSQGSLISDNKMVYLDYTPVKYPFTMVYESETSDSNTAFLPQWFPIDEPFCSVEKSIVTVNYPSDLGFKYKNYNFAPNQLVETKSANSLTLSVENLPATKAEQYSPSFSQLVPYTLFGLEKFKLEGVEGDAASWQSFGKWMHDNLLVGTDALSDETKSTIRTLVGAEKDPIAKARIVYQYMQSKTRYVSIQLGIGGWKPMLAKDVDRLGYGDCKALTNYTKALLDAVGVQSHYAVIYGDEQKRSLNPDFVSMQGNHVILAIPNNNAYTWLECTSQTAPFGFQANFTDDRMALLIKPEGGELVRTTVYDSKKNAQQSEGRYAIDADGVTSGTVRIKSHGTQFDYKQSLTRLSQTDLDLHYKNYFSNVNNLKVKKATITNDRDVVEFVEDIIIEAERYASVDQNRIIFPVNLFNQQRSVPQRYRTRTNPVEISRGYFDYDDIIIDLPAGYKIEAKPDNALITEKFGEYKTEYELISENQVRYKRYLEIKEGQFDTKDYESFRKFRENIARNDNAKMVLVKI